MKKCCILITAVCAIITLASCSNMLEDLRKAKNKRNVEIVIKTVTDDSKKTNRVKITVDTGDKEIEKTGYVFSEPDAEKNWKNAEEVLNDSNFTGVTKDTNGQYIITATENGDYTVAVKDKNGNSTYKTVTVDNIIPVDVNIPEVSSNKKGESFTVTVKGLNIAAEDFDENTFTVTCRDSSGNEVTEVTQGAKVTRNDNGSISVVLTIPEQTGEYDVTIEYSTKEYGEVCLAGTLKVGNYNIYSVKFDTDGGNKVDAQTVKEGEKAQKPADPTKTDDNGLYMFQNWYDDKGIVYDFSKGVTSNITLKAKWHIFVKVEGSTVVGDDKFTYSKATNVSDDYKGVFVKGRNVKIDTFYMCDHEVTQGEYEEYCLYDSTAPSDRCGKGNDYPAYYVSWYDAVIYCNLRSKAEGLKPAYYFAEADGTEIQDGREISEWRNRLGDSIIHMEKTGNVEKYCFAGGPDEDMTRLDYSGDKDKDGGICFDQKANGYRLPTDAEWEYAARGGKEGVNKDTPDDWAGTNSEDDLKYYAWYANNSGSKAHIVKSDKDIDTDSANTLGLYDMTGNVYEWCWDWYNYDVTKGDKKNSNGVVANPCGASSGSYRLIRGGSWFDDAEYCSVSIRNGSYPNCRWDNSGFRLVRSAQ